MTVLKRVKDVSMRCFTKLMHSTHSVIMLGFHLFWGYVLNSSLTLECFNFMAVERTALPFFQGNQTENIK